MQRAVCATVLALLAVTAASYSKPKPPPKETPMVSYIIDSNNPSPTHFLTQAEIDNIVDFVRTIDGVNHHVLNITVRSAVDVEVQTGPERVEPGKWWTGNTVHIQKHDGQWRILEKSQWESNSSPAEEEIYIWDGKAELMLSIQLIDAVTKQPVREATVSIRRDARVGHGPDGVAFKIAKIGKTDPRGRATLKGTFPAAGDAKGVSVFVLQSCVRAEARGYAPTEALISEIGRCDFERHVKKYEVVIHIALTPSHE